MGRPRQPSSWSINDRPIVCLNPSPGLGESRSGAVVANRVGVAIGFVGPVHFRLLGFPTRPGEGRHRAESWRSSGNSPSDANNSRVHSVIRMTLCKAIYRILCQRICIFICLSGVAMCTLTLAVSTGLSG